MGHPAFDEGMKACHLNYGRHTNHYPKGSESHTEWNNGYDYAQDTCDGPDFDPYL